MRSGILFSFVLGLFICIVEVRGDCECLPKEVKTNSGKIIGNCKSEDYTSSAGKYEGRKWCYIKKDGCDCENTTKRFGKLCVSYSACGGVTVTEDEDDEEEEDDYDYEEDEDDYYEEYEEDEEEEEEEEDSEEIVGARVTGPGTGARVGR